MLRRLTRLATLLAGFLALQLSLAAGGPACAMPGAGMVGMAGMGGMAGAMSGTPVMAGMGASAGADTHVPADGATTARAAVPASDEAPCDESGGPRACQTMTPCATAFVATRAPLPGGAPPGAAHVIAAGVLAPPSQSSPPELPPPRA